MFVCFFVSGREDSFIFTRWNVAFEEATESIFCMMGARNGFFFMHLGFGFYLLFACAVRNFSQQNLITLEEVFFWFINDSVVKLIYLFICLPCELTNSIFNFTSKWGGLGGWRAETKEGWCLFSKDIWSKSSRDYYEQVTSNIMSFSISYQLLFFHSW